MVLNNNQSRLLNCPTAEATFIQHIIIFFFLSNMGTFVYFVSCQFVMFLIFATIFKKKIGSVLRVVTVSQLQCQTWNNTVITICLPWIMCSLFFVLNFRIFGSCLTCFSSVSHKPETCVAESWNHDNHHHHHLMSLKILNDHRLCAKIRTKDFLTDYESVIQ